MITCSAMRAYEFGVLGSAFLFACGSEFSSKSLGPGADASSGGASVGGSSGTGGQHTGGTPATGGTSGTGGVFGGGGVSSTGGVSSSGGVSTTGGAPGTGGVPTTGGVPATGGVSSTGGTSSTGGGATDPCLGIACPGGYTCCNGKCVTPTNDPFNCGKCANQCPDSAPLCYNGGCTVPSCTPIVPCASGDVCCGSSCCANGTICCESQGQLTVIVSCADPSQFNGTCPPLAVQAVCASPDTALATPSGSRAIATLRVGDHVFSVDHGHIVDVPIIAVHRRAARHHSVIHVELESGSVLEISAPHPTADGRTFGDLRAGDMLSGERIRSVAVVPYTSAYTYDILPASDSGTYFAGGVLIGSTLGGTALAAGTIEYAPLSME